LKPDVIAPGFNLIAAWPQNLGLIGLPEDTKCELLCHVRYLNGMSSCKVELELLFVQLTQDGA
ncbi:subtilisin-like protease SDD1-like, partial [Trifolium medium]|nr:subtilisin-like protease SDD1-like [Trifolium medium]